MFLEVVCEVMFVVIIFFAPVILGCFLWECTNFRPAKWFYHDKIGLHDPDMHKGSYMDEQGNVHAFCKYCGSEIKEDPVSGFWIIS